MAQNGRGFWSFGKKVSSELQKNARAKNIVGAPQYFLMWKKNLDFHVFGRFSEILGVFMAWTHEDSTNTLSENAITLIFDGFSCFWNLIFQIRRFQPQKNKID